MLHGNTMTDSDTETMKDVAHTPPNETSAARVWERGNEARADSEVEEE